MRCSSPLTPAPCPGSPGRAASPSFLPSFPLGAGLGGLGWGWGKPEGFCLFGEHLPGAPLPGACQPWGGREALGGLWDGARPQNHLWAVCGGAHPEWVGEERKGSGPPPSAGSLLCSEASPRGCLLPAGWKWLEERAGASPSRFPSLCGLLESHWLPPVRS